MAKPFRTHRPVRIWAIIDSTRQNTLDPFSGSREIGHTSEWEVNDRQNRLLTRVPQTNIPHASQPNHLQVFFRQDIHVLE